MIAAELGRIDAMRLLAENGANMHVKNKVRMFSYVLTVYVAIGGSFTNKFFLVYSFRAQYGETALMYVSRNGKIDGMRMILEDGADTNVKDMVRTTTCCQCIKNSTLLCNVFLDSCSILVHAAAFCQSVHAL